MNKKAVWMVSGFAFACVTYAFIAATPAGSGSNVQAKIGIVDFKLCLESSKVGKQEQGRFDAIKKQMETTIEAKDKEMSELAPKFKDEYMDTLTPEAEAELKEKFKRVSGELSQLQNQYYQLMNQANYQIVQKMGEWIDTASEKVAKDKGIDIVLNEEACFFSAPSYDISSDVVKELDNRFAQEEKTVSKPQAPEKK